MVEPHASKLSCFLLGIEFLHSELPTCCIYCPKPQYYVRVTCVLFVLRSMILREMLNHISCDIWDSSSSRKQSIFDFLRHENSSTSVQVSEEVRSTLVLLLLVFFWIYSSTTCCATSHETDFTFCAIRSTTITTIRRGTTDNNVERPTPRTIKGMHYAL